MRVFTSAGTPTLSGSRSQVDRKRRRRIDSTYFLTIIERQIIRKWSSTQTTILLSFVFKVWTWKEKANLKKQADYFFKPGTRRQPTLKNLLLLIMWLDIKTMFPTN